MARDEEPDGTADEPDRSEDEPGGDSDEPTVEEQSEQSFPASDPPSY
jgi:hypothetical protein